MVHFVEGIFGAGKTTYAERLYNYYIRRKREAEIFYEHDVKNTIDFTRKALLTEKEFGIFVRECKACFDNSEIYDAYCNEIYFRTEQFLNFRLLSYAELPIPNMALYNLLCKLQKREICNGLVPCEQYAYYIKRKWQQWECKVIKSKEYIYEGALFQNILIDLLAFYNLNDEEVIAFYEDMFTILRKMEVEVIFIYVDNIEKNLLKINRERKANEFTWLETLDHWMEQTSYRVEKEVSGIEKVVFFCEEIQRLSELLLKEYEIKKTILKRR